MDRHARLPAIFHATSRVRWVVMIMLAVCLVVVTVLAASLAKRVLIEYRGGLRHRGKLLVCFGLMIPYVLALGAVWDVVHNAKDEQHLVTMVKRLLDADEV